MDAELLRQFNEIQRENLELKRMYADLSLDHSLLEKVIEKSFKALSKESHCRGTGARRKNKRRQGLPDY